LFPLFKNRTIITVIYENKSDDYFDEDIYLINCLDFNISLYKDATAILSYDFEVVRYCINKRYRLNNLKEHLLKSEVLYLYNLVPYSYGNNELFIINNDFDIITIKYQNEEYYVIKIDLINYCNFDEYTIYSEVNNSLEFKGIKMIFLITNTKIQ